MKAVIQSMKRFPLNLLILLFNLTVTFAGVYAQRSDGYYKEYFIAPNQDTLLLHRRLGDWWIGAFAGVNAGLFFGDLKLPWTTDIPDSLLRYINMPTGSGIATVFGVYGEWLPENENWGASLKVTLYDNRYGLSETPELDSINM